jgi:hypothetical protein
MKGANVISTVQHLKIAQSFMEDFIRERPSSALSRLFRTYRTKIEWIFNDIKSEPLLPQIVRDGINQELRSDVLAVVAINEKVALLPPDQRELVEVMIDGLLSGKEIKLVG